MTNDKTTPLSITPDSLVAALIALAEHGIPADVQELLVQGNPSLGIAPGALAKALSVVSLAQAAAVAEYSCPDCGAKADERWDCCQVHETASVEMDKAEVADRLAKALKDADDLDDWHRYGEGYSGLRQGAEKLIEASTKPVGMAELTQQFEAKGAGIVPASASGAKSEAPTTMSRNLLKPCPHCEELPSLSENNVPGNWYGDIECSNRACEVRPSVSFSGPFEKAIEEVEQWNNLSSADASSSLGDKG